MAAVELAVPGGDRVVLRAAVRPKWGLPSMGLPRLGDHAGGPQPRVVAGVAGHRLRNHQRHSGNARLLGCCAVDSGWSPVRGFSAGRSRLLRNVLYPCARLGRPGLSAVLFRRPWGVRGMAAQPFDRAGAGPSWAVAYLASGAD